MSELKLVYSLSRIMHRAWTLARWGAQRFGGTARQYLAAALRQAWQDVKASVRQAAEAEARVLAEVEKMKAERAFGPVRPLYVRPLSRRHGVTVRV